MAKASEVKTIIAKRATQVKEYFGGPVRDYSIEACRRAIPDGIDGFKPSQRKGIYAITKKTGIDPQIGIKVAQLAAFAAEITAYAHGEGSLAGTIVKLAQDFPGSNNINYLDPIGQFGSYLSPAAAADRYIYTALKPEFRKIFIKEDDLILEAQYDDGDEIEPKRFLPILPNVLINGANGMGTGFSTNIMSYNPADLKQYILNKLNGKKQTKQLVPWFRGYKGKVSKTDGGQVVIEGVFERVGDKKLHITQLPIGVFQEKYTAFLNDQEDMSANKIVKSYDNNSDLNGWSWTITTTLPVDGMSDEDILKRFRLISRETENFTVWTHEDKLHTFESPEALCDYFVDYRLLRYEDRRQAVMKELEANLELFREKIRFIKFYIANSKQVAQKTKAELEALLKEQKFTRIDELISIRIYNLTRDQIEKLEKDEAETNNKLDFYKKVTPTELYVTDLTNLKL